MSKLSQQFVDLIIRGKDLFSREADKSEQALNDLKKASKETKTELDNLEKTQQTLAKVQGLETVLEGQREAMQKASAAADAYAKQLDNTKKPLKEQVLEFARLKQAATAATREYQKTATQLDKQRTVLEQAGVNTRELGAEQERLANQSKDLTRKLEEAKQATIDFVRAMGEDEKLRQQAASAQKAVKAYQDYAEAMSRAERPTRAQMDRLDALNEEAQRSVQIFKGVAQSLGQKIIEMERAGQETKALADSYRKLNQESNTLKTQLTDASTKAAATSKRFDEMGRESGKATGQIRGLASSLIGFGAAYVGIDTVTTALRKFFTTAGQMEDFRYQMIGVYDDVAKGNAAYDWVVNFAKNVPPALEDVMQSFIMLHNQGMDPMNGTLEKLIAANSKYGKGNATLVPIIRQLTQAWAKNRIQAEEMYVLVENGLPVWDMLSDATGKSVGQLQKMAEQGKLTRYELAQLIEVMGARSMASMSQRMETFNTTLSKMGDRINQILDRIARSGALTYFKNELDKAGEAIDRMAKNGELKKLALDISQGMVAAAKAIKEVAVFTYQWGEAIVTVVAAIGALKAITFFRDLARDMGPLITKTQSWGAYSLALIPKLKVMYLGLAGAVAFTASEFYKLASAAYEWYEAERNLEESEKLLSKTQQDKADLLKQYSAQLGITIKNMDDYHRLLKDGAIIYDDLSGKLMTAEQYQKALSERVVKAEREWLPFSQTVEELVNQMSSMIDRGDKAGAVLKNMMESIDPKNIGQVATLGQALDKVREQGLLTEKQLREGLAEALTELSGEELIKFQYAVGLTFQNMKDSALSTGQVMTDALTGALRKMGLDIQEVNNQFTDLGRDMVNTLEAIALNANQSNADLKSAAMAAIGLAKTQTDLNQLSEKIRELGQRGLLSGTQVADALLTIEGKLATLTREASRTEQALSRLGVVSLSALSQELRQAAADFEAISAAQKRGEATTYQVKQAFLSWAKAAVNVAQANDQAIPATVATTAAALGLNKELADLIGSYQGAAANGKTFTQSLGNIELKATATERVLASLSERQKKLAESQKEVAQASKAAAQSQQQLADGLQESSGMASVMDDHVAAIKNELTALSEATYRYYLQLRNSPMQNASAESAQFKDELQALNHEVVELSRRMLTASDMGQFFVETSLAAARAELEYKKQARALENLTRKLGDTSLSTQGLVDMAKKAKGSFDLLDSTQLSGLQSAIAAAESRLKSMNQSAESTLQSLREELAGLNGNVVEQERLRMMQKRADLESKMAEARAAGNSQAVSDYSEALSLLKKVEQQKLAAARKTQLTQQAQKAATNEPTPPPAAEVAPAKPAQPEASPAQVKPIEMVRFEININGKQSVAYTVPSERNDLIDVLQTLKQSSF
ncbi:tape measure protein [Vibrio cholerae]|nr:tape measure protein [Vibrio cholerae]